MGQIVIFGIDLAEFIKGARENREMSNVRSTWDAGYLFPKLLEANR